jgi:hypothetical protein
MINCRDIAAKCQVVNIDKKEKYSLVKLRTSRKDKKTEEWVSSSWSFVKFIGTAHETIAEIADKLNIAEKFDNGDAKQGIPILIKSLSIENASYIDKISGERKYPKNYALVVWSWGWRLDNPEINMDTPPIVANTYEEETEELPF